jgi:AraC-like DNA-binding protein
METIMSTLIEVQLHARAGTLPLSIIAGEFPDNVTEWHFGDLTLTRQTHRDGRGASDWNALRRIQSQGCVILVCSQSSDTPQALIASPSASAAFAELARMEHDPDDAGETVTLFLPNFASHGAERTITAHIQRFETDAGPGALLAGFMLYLVRHAHHLKGDRAELLALATRALVEACTSPLRLPIAPAISTPASRVVERARSVVQQHMAEPDFGPSQLARHLAMSRSKLYRLLDGDGGVAHFINRERLRKAWRSLTTPGDALSVSAIADLVGFRDHSTFSRAFRREYGCTPTEVRGRALLAHLSMSPPAGDQLAVDARPALNLDCVAGQENDMNGADLGF